MREIQKVIYEVHVSKRVYNRARSRIRPEIEKEWCGFVKDTETGNIIFIIRMITEREI